MSALPCVPGGPTQQDASNAAALNPQLAKKMRGNMNAYNSSCARAVVQAVKGRGLNQRAAAIAIATTIVESSIANLDSGDRDSVGLFQQRSSWGTFAERTNPVWATNKFLDVMESFYPNGSWNTAPIGEVAANVQRPAAQYRYRYAVEADDAVKIANALWNMKRPSLSGEGRAEIMALHDNGDIQAWYNVAGFKEMPWGGSVTIGRGFSDPSRVRFADLDGDGYSDIIAIQENGDVQAWHNGGAFKEMPWDGAAIIGRDFFDPNRVRLADLDGDGRAEIMAIQENGDIQAWHNGGGFKEMPWDGAAIIGRGFLDPNEVQLADLDGDGRAEIMAIHPNGEIQAWYNAGGFKEMPWGDSTIVGRGFTDPSRARFADLDGDGRAEIMAIQSNGDVQAWHNDGGFKEMPWGASLVIAIGFTDPTRTFFP
ncbi:FG-GAP repeat domain-containing protein [Pendulispora albinea]|uniref:VCBS repeat-containing protein n=1 Tax=Pendulispora albinea TaxID=2741071 RepID=A0ABZ2M3Q7_9BACT